VAVYKVPPDLLAGFEKGTTRPSGKRKQSRGMEEAHITQMYKNDHFP